MRVRFTSTLACARPALAAFTVPRSAFAIEEPINLSAIPNGPAWPEPTDELDVVFCTPASRANWERTKPDWLAPAPVPDAVQPITIASSGTRISWRPGRAVIESDGADRTDFLAALAEFAFVEGELRTLEAAIERHEAQARTDASMLFRIERKDREHWPRFQATIVELARHRLTLAALAPRLERGSRHLPSSSRRIVSRLLRAVSAADRCEALDLRLEVCEELYEGAVDRITDHQGWYTGHVLEIIIILLLLLEGVLIAVEVAASMSRD
jgi:hypothetical protein